jgi:uncharacterized membrane protein YhaH (DUF805 family)
MLRACLHLLSVLDYHPAAWGALAGGFIFLWSLVAMALIIFTIYCTWRVAAKCGYPGAYSLLMLIPIVNILVQLVWVFSEWPIETELRRLRGANPQGAIVQPPR